jgi:hypothetical protein
MAARPDLPLKPPPANLLPKSRRSVRPDMRALEQRLASFAFGIRLDISRRAFRADLLTAVTEISSKRRRR